MSILKWDKSLEIGHKKIDEQHKGLVQLLNDLHSAMSLGVTGSDYTPIRMKLYKYTVYHFTEEEALMDHTGYKLRAEHEREHNSFLVELDKLAEKSRSGDNDVGTEIIAWLVDWLLGHISVTDKKLVVCLNTVSHEDIPCL